MSAQEDSSRKQEMAACFESIIAGKKWGSGPTLPGSSLEATFEIRDFLAVLLENGKYTALIDYGCGPDSWILSIPVLKSGNITYYGVDILESIIAQRDANQSFNEVPSVFFHDITTVEEATRSAKRLVIVKDVLMHLSGEHLALALKELSQFDTVLVIEDKPGELSKEEKDELGGYKPWRWVEDFLALGFKADLESAAEFVYTRPVSKLGVIYTKDDSQVLDNTSIAALP